MTDNLQKTESNAATVQDIAFYAYVVLSGVWAASDRPYSTLIAVIWALAAGVILVARNVCRWRAKKQTHNAK